MADSNLTLEIISPEGITFTGAVPSVSLPALNGRITVLPHHAPLFTKLEEGEIEFKVNGRDNTIVIFGGFLEVKDNRVHVLSDYAVRAESIQIAKSEERKRMAEQKLKDKLNNEEFAIADKDLRISLLELKIADKIRKRQRSQ
jgi:F-type H+-transporting ATPase subunit epsilon